MTVAMTNEERFIASCQREGEAGVRQKVNEGRYSERRAAWASEWLDLVDSGKSDATRAEERSRRLLTPTRRLSFKFVSWATFIVILASGFLAFVMWR